MTKSVTKIQDKDTTRRLSVVRSTEDPTKYGIVILNPDGSRIRGPKGEAATVNVGTTTTSNPGTSASVENSGDSSHAILNFTIPRGATVSVGSTTTGNPGTSASVTNSGQDGDVVLNFTIPKGDKGDKGEEGNGIESVTSSKVGKTTTVTIYFTDGGTPYSFQILDGEGAGDVVGPNSAGDGNIALYDGTTGKLIKDSGLKVSEIKGSWVDVTVTTAYNTADKVGTTTAGDYTPTKGDFLLVNFVNGCSVNNPTLNIDGSGAKAIRTGSANASTATFGLGSTAGSNIKALLYYDGTYYRCWSTTNNNTTYSAMSVSEGQTGTATNSRAMRADYLKKIIKYHSVSDVAYGDSWDGVTDIAPSKNVVYDKIKGIDDVIPSAATSSNQLADKNYVNDSINSVTAYYITKNAQGAQFATYSELANATTFYSGGVVRVPTRNDYTIVLDDENHDHATTRYSYNSGWEYQYTVNETALTQAQLNALNSGITSGKVSQYDGYASGKQDALTLPSAPTSGHLVTWGANNKILVDGGEIPTVPTNVSSFNNDAGYLTSSTGVTSVNGSNGAVNVNDVKASSSAPSNPTEGMVWYDKTNDVLKVYDGANWVEVGGGGEGNTKTFYLSSTSDLTTAQSAYDWYKAGNNPIIQYKIGSNTIPYTYIIENRNTSGTIRFKSVELSNTNAVSSSYQKQNYIDFTISSDTVTAISANVTQASGNFLATDVNYGTPYTPIYNGSPATKKYVDDKKTEISVTLTTAGWSSNTQSVTATGVTDSNTVIVSPNPSSMSIYTDAKVFCSAQGSNSLTFSCTTEPTSDIMVNVLILN